MREGESTFRLRLILLLPLLMLLAQQGGWLHQLDHAAYSAADPARVLAHSLDNADDGAPCSTCQGFGQISCSASAHPPYLALLSPGYLPGAQPRVAVIAAAQPSPRNRGPPAKA